MSLTLTPYDTRLPANLRALQTEIEGYAREQGLDFYETIFEVLDADDLNEVAAYGGFPTRYPHWSFGMAYEELKKGYEYGLSKIYEMVINNDPCYAYLMRCNNVVDQKLVMAHVYGHCDFFKNNCYFAHTSRKMMDEMANHGTRIRRHVEKYGEDEVETFLDKCKSIEDLIDIHSVAIKRRAETSRFDFKPEDNGDDDHATRFKSKSYMDEYVNPRDRLKAEEEERKKSREQAARNFPERPEKDVLLFLIEHAPLKGWQRDILEIVRDEAYYFSPQAQTKIMNEGWASYVHSTIMTTKALHPSEVIDYCDHHSGTMASYGARLNPYKLGIELFRHIEHRWNTGRFGKEWEECDDLEKKRTWDKQLGLGRQKIFEVRRNHNDITFIDTFLTPEFCIEQNYFSFLFNEQLGTYVIDSREFEKIKKQILFNLTNYGRPWIYVIDGNYRNRGELLLRHVHEGIDLKLDYAKDTLANIQFIWNRPVHLQTVVDNKPMLLSFDGSEHSQNRWETPMTLADTLTEKLASWQPPDSPRPVFGHADVETGVAARVEFEQVDRLSGRVWEISATRSNAARAAVPGLADWARQTADRVTGLLEPLKLIEVDPALGKAMLRSEEPTRKKADRFYHEVILTQGGHASVRRFRGTYESSVREQVPYAITHEALAKLIADIVE